MSAWLRQYGIGILTTVSGAIGAAVKFALSARKKKKRQQEAAQKRQEALEEGLRGLLHHDIYQGCIECQRKGFADVQDRQNLDALYGPYHTLGGNGTGTDLYNKARALPIEPQQP